MIKPLEMSLDLPMSITNGERTTTGKVWEMLTASRAGDLAKMQKLAAECPAIVFAQYNYTPPIHFAVREGHVEIVECLLDQGAHDPTYKTYPFLDTLQTVAADRGFEELVTRLDEYAADPSRQKYSGDNGEIHYERSDEAVEFQRSIAKHKIALVRELLEQHPELALDNTIFWGEGVLMRSANDPDREMLELLLSYGATVPTISKWGRAYYFKHYEIAAFLMENGMDANHMTWHHVTLLHDMAQEGDIAKAKLLLEHGAEINSIEEEYQSTPLGLAARWAHLKMVKFLLERGADPKLSGAEWSTPLAWARAKGHRDVEAMLSSS